MYYPRVLFFTGNNFPQPVKERKKIRNFRVFGIYDRLFRFNLYSIYFDQTGNPLNDDPIAEARQVSHFASGDT
jgi:hypothetical protein